MKVTINGRAVPPSPTPTGGFHVTYQGCPVHIFPKPAKESRRGYDARSGTCLINWYGQTLSVYLQSGDAAGSGGYTSASYTFAITVRSGTPFDLRSPSRRGVQANAKWRDFVAWVGDRCGEYLAKQPIPPAPADVVLAMETWPKLKTRLPWCVVCDPARGYSAESEVVRYADLSQYIVLSCSAATAFDSDRDAEDETEGFEVMLYDEDSDAELISILPPVWQTKLRTPRYAFDPDRMPCCSLQFHLSDKREDLLDGVALYGACEAKLVGSNGLVLDSAPIRESAAFVEETTSYELDEATGAVFGAAAENLAPSDFEGLLRQFWYEDEEDREASETACNRQIAEWVAAREGGTKADALLHGDDTIDELLSQLKYRENTTLKVVHEGGRFWGFELTPGDGGPPRKLRVL